MSRANLFRFPGRGSHILLVAIFLRAMTTICTVSGAQAQTEGGPPIRVESHEVLVPVLVVDKKRLHAVHQMDVRTYTSAVDAPNSHFLVDLAVTGLTTADFHVFEDGKEQQVERVTPKDVAMFGDDSAPGIGPVYESSHGYVPAIENAVRAPVWPAYLVAYSQPPSLDGSCHKVRITVDRPASVVYARPEYCNTTHAPNDSLNGTKLGYQLRQDLDSAGDGRLTFLATAFSSLHAAAATYTDIVLEAPEKPRLLADCDKLPEIGVLGLVYAADGNVAARFSGLTLGDSSQRGQSWFSPLPTRTSCTIAGARIFHARVDLPSGEYKLRAVIRDGDHVGRTEMPITVDQLDGTQLAISSVVLGRKYRQVPESARDNLVISPGRYVPLVSRGWEIIPTADTTFKQAEFLTFYAEVYSPVQAASQDRTVQVHMRIADERTGHVVKELRPLDTAPYSKPGEPVIPVGGGVDIGGLASGSYRLELQATDSLGESTAWRSVAFRIE
ncbi:MAG: hypothetical protein WB949_12760 [Candidatus Acidiferrales bacterium]